MIRRCLSSLVVCLVFAAPARGQVPATLAAAGSCTAVFDLLNSSQVKIESSGDVTRLIGQVELPCGENRFFADQIELHGDTKEVVAIGSVVFSGPDGQIAADRVEFNASAGTGMFYNAAGLMSLGETADRAQFGNQDADIYFWGETIEQLGNRRYKITRGGFTACVQPTPRWDMQIGSMELNLNDYALARNTVLRVKGVPVMYLPWIYYPLQDDQRSTGFLLPTYGTSTLRGQAVSNAFFWATGRSHDATFFHDWYTRAGQGAGVEFRYVAAAQSSGNFRVYRFSQRQTESLPELTSFEVSGVATHAFAPGVRGRARVDFFSHLGTQQLYHQNVYSASRPGRVIEGSLTAGLGALSTSVLYQRNEVFETETRRQVLGSTPRVTAILAPQRLFSAPIYAAVNADYAYLPYRSTDGGLVTRDDTVNRVDVSPSLRVPLSRLTFLSVNTSAAYRTTYYTRSYDAAEQETVPGSYLRQYIALRSDVVGPVFTRIWDLPESGFAERVKHVVEPAFTVDFTSAIADFRRTPVLSDVSDVVVGGATRVTYGLTNRFFYRGRAAGGARGPTREFITAGIQQTYYSNPEGSQFDATYRSAQGGGRSADLSPIALNVRVSPTAAVDTNARVEYDVSGRGLQVVTVGGNLNVAGASANVNYSHFRRDTATPSDDYVSASTNLRFLQGRATGTYALSWDIARSYIVSQSIMATYMAQCCGLQVEFQTFNLPDSIGLSIPEDRRFNFGFVLAGLGTFSNFFGAFGGQP